MLPLSVTGAKRRTDFRDRVIRSEDRGERDMDFFSDEPHRERSRVPFRLFLIEVLSITNAESPVMDPASNLIVIDESVRQGGTRVGAAVVQCVELSVDVEDSDWNLIHHEHSCRTLRYVTDIADHAILRHRQDDQC